MVDYFSEQSSASYIRAAVLFAVVVGTVELVLALKAPDLVSNWAIVEGVLVLALAFGLWRRKFSAAVALFALKTAGALIWSYQTGQAPHRDAIIQVVVYGLAAAAIFFGRSGHVAGSSKTHSSAATGGSSESRTG